MQMSKVPIISGYEATKWWGTAKFLIIVDFPDF
jgi:hypothetical protein